MENTIVAVATPLGKGAISIVRMSGKQALKIALKFFNCNCQIQPRKLVLGQFDLGDVKEKCLMVYFKAPFSYTGEDVVEFQIHGGVTVTRLIQEKLIQGGATLAQPGEFSKRAFENAKISLDEAEAIVEEINSESEAQLKSALSLASGKLNQQIKNIQSSLTNLLAHIEVSMDYPEEDENEIVRDEIFKTLEENRLHLKQILDQANQSRFIKNGINIALVGKTNVGKSSLLNALVGENKAIVTDIEGTTRDVVEASIDYNGIRLNFYDTAGIRESDNAVEKIGIEKSKKTLDECDIVLIIYDGSENLTKNDENIKKIIKKPFISVINKQDKMRKLAKQENEIEVSALENKNIEKLKEKIFKTAIKKSIDFNGLVVTNERQMQHINQAIKQINEVFKQKNQSLEILSMLIKNVWNTLGKITGETENEDIISVIFSKFCVGK